MSDAKSKDTKSPAKHTQEQSLQPSVSPTTTRTKAPRTSLCLELVAILLLPLVFVTTWLIVPERVDLITLIAALLSTLLFFISYELGRPDARQTSIVVVFAALAAAGRILFAAIPSVKPTSALTIIAGIHYGRKAGFMVGALAGLVSNFFFGQGAWTPWQMYAWGMVGWLAGLLAQRGLFNKRPFIYVYGFASGLLFGFIMNIWSVLGFLHPQTLSEFIGVFSAAIPYDLIDCVATTVFLLVLYRPLSSVLDRLKSRYSMN